MILGIYAFVNTVYISSLIHSSHISLQPDITGKSNTELTNKDPHYAPLDMDKVAPRGPYASLRYACSGTADSPTREYAIPPDAVATPEGLTSESADSSSPKPVGTFGKLDDTTKTAESVSQVSSKTKSAGKKKPKPKLPKKTSGGKSPTPLAVENPAYCTLRQDDTSPSGVKTLAGTATATSVASKQEKAGKKKNPLTLPASAKLQSFTAKKASGGTESSIKPTVAELTQRLEKGNL